jgi:hypothetical protein
MFALQSDGRIVVLGPQYLVRTTPQAHALDIAGVAGGLGYVPVATQINNVQGKLKYGTALAQAASGKWLVAGGGYYSQAASSNIDFVAVRVNADFSLDQNFNSVVDANNVTFAGGALVAFDIGGSSPDAAEAVVIQSDGRIVLAGTATTGSSNRRTDTLDFERRSGLNLRRQRHRQDHRPGTLSAFNAGRSRGTHAFRPW